MNLEQDAAARTGFFERGLHWPAGIALGLALMVLWNGYFLAMALQNPPGVDPEWTHAVDR